METKSTRVHRCTVAIDTAADFVAHNVSPLFDGEGQAQIIGGDYSVILHLSGTPASWRHLAKVIEDAAMELEGQMARNAAEHYAAMADESEHWARLDDPADIGATS